MKRKKGHGEKIYFLFLTKSYKKKPKEAFVMFKPSVLIVALGVLIGSVSTGYCTRPNVDVWNLRHDEGSGAFGEVVFDGNLFVAVGHDPVGTIFKSSDGETWNSATSGSTALLSGATYGEGLFIVTGSGGEILSSTDGVIWTKQGDGITTETLSCAAYGDGFFLAGGSGGKIVKSVDGTSWVEYSTTEPAWLYGMEYGDGSFVSVGGGGVIQTSPDGQVWTKRISGTGNDLNSVTYGFGLFVAVGTSGTILSSPDGVSWTPKTSGVVSRLSGVHYAYGKFVAVGDSGVILYSADGTNWSKPNSGAFSNLVEVTAGKNTFVVVGEERKAYQSATEGMNVLYMSPALR